MICYETALFQIDSTVTDEESNSISSVHAIQHIRMIFLFGSHSFVFEGFYETEWIYINEMYGGNFGDNWPSIWMINTDEYDIK